MTKKNVLELPMRENDAGAATVKDYFKALLKAIITEGEGFSGKRPFGNSGWENDLEAALVRGGAVKGRVIEGEDWCDADNPEAVTKALLKAIDAL